jgi:hypothetical protein
MLDFTPTASMDVVGEKLGMDQWVGQLACYGFRQEPFFSVAVSLSNVVDDVVKGCHVW